MRHTIATIATQIRIQELISQRFKPCQIKHVGRIPIENPILGRESLHLPSNPQMLYHKSVVLKVLKTLKFGNANPVGSKWKFIAAVALLWVAFFDLALPRLCSSEFFSRQTQESPFDLKKATSSLDSNGSPSNPDFPFRTNSEDDCWCCCSHVTPASAIEVATEPLATVQEPVYRASLVFASTPAPYHPPRS